MSALSKRPDRYYFAYGSNLNRRQMKRRCPFSKPMQTLKLNGWELVFRGVADIKKSKKKGAFVQGAIYAISEFDEAILDIYEGCRADGLGKYRKEYLEHLTVGGTKVRVLVYVMNSSDIYGPTNEYLERIETGYADWKLDSSRLLEIACDAEERDYRISELNASAAIVEARARVTKVIDDYAWLPKTKHAIKPEADKELQK